MGLFGLLRAVPHGYDPNRLAAYAVEEPVGSDDDLTDGGDRGNSGSERPDSGYVFEAAKHLFDAATKLQCCAGFVTTDIFEGGEKLGAR